MATATSRPPASLAGLSLAEIAARYAPATGWATIVVPPAGVELGDIIDHTAGLLVVTAITRRHATWTLAGYNPADPPHAYWALGGGTWQDNTADGTPPPAPLARHVTAGVRIRVRRLAEHWQRLPGHTRTVTSRNPRKSGCYTLVEGYDVTCKCGWTGHSRSRGGAAQAHATHRADAITQSTRTAYGLDAIEDLEQQLGDVLPWRWNHGAQAQLRGLTTAQALARLTPWATALGADIEHMSANDAGLGGPHFLWIDSRSDDTSTPGLDIRAYPVDQAPADSTSTG
jgi:hypothetical protein